jgi:hypothetical protein
MCARGRVDNPPAPPDVRQHASGIRSAGQYIERLAPYVPSFADEGLDLLMFLPAISIEFRDERPGLK